MTSNKVSDKNKIKQGDRTDWEKVINQSDDQIERNSTTDPDSPELKNKKYYKPGKNASESS